MHSSRLERALAIYSDWLAAGATPPASALIAAHPDLAEHLQAMLTDPAATTDQLAIGDTVLGRELADFVILAEIGRGGMGVVYLARQRSLGREVALKVLPAHITNQATVVARFKREATLAARLEHPAIVAIFAVGSDGDTHWFAMERIDGGALGPNDPATGQPRTIRRTVELFATLADALAHAHAANVPHRDVKPANILLRATGEPVLCDFGLARELGDPGITVVGGFAGTPWYASPEQLVDSSSIDARSDVWSLGATMYELLTGRRPFDGDSSHAITQAIAHQEPIDPLRLAPELAPDLAAIVLKALHKDRERRYRSAAALRDELRAFLEFRPITARRSGRLTRVARWLQRHPGWRAAVLLLVLATLLLPALISIAVAGERDRAMTAEQLARRQAYAANVQAAHTALSAGDGAQAAQLLAACPPDLRGFEWHFVEGSLDSSLWHDQPFATGVTAVAMAADASALVAGDEQGAIAVFETIGGTARWQLPPRGSSVSKIAVIPATDLVVVIWADGRIAAHALAAGQPLGDVAPLPTHLGTAIAIDGTVLRQHSAGQFRKFAPRSLQPSGDHTLPVALDRPHRNFATDGQRVVGVPPGSGISRWNLTTGERVLCRTLATSGDLSATGDLQRIAGFDPGIGIWWWDPESNAARQMSHGQHTVNCLELSPDGKDLVVGCQRGELLVYALEQARLKRVLHGNQTSITAVDSVAGGWIATGAADGTVRLWNSFLDAGAGELSGTGFGVSLSGPGFGRGLVAGAAGSVFLGGLDGTVRRVDVHTGALIWQRQLPHWINGLTLVAGGQLAASYHEVVVFLDASNGALQGDRCQLPPIGYARRIAASLDGHKLAVLGDSGNLVVVDVATHTVSPPVQACELRAFSRAGGLAWAGSPPQVWAGGEDRRVRAFDPSTLAVATELPFDTTIATLAQDGDALLIAGWNRDQRRGTLQRTQVPSGRVLATTAVTVPIAAMTTFAGRIATARWDGRLGLLRHDTLEPIVELPQPAPTIWNVAGSPDGDWLALQCQEGEPRVLQAGSVAHSLADHRARAMLGAAREIAGNALLPTGWVPLARSQLQSRTDLAPELQSAALAMLPPVAPWRLLDIAGYLAMANDGGEEWRARMRVVRECLAEARTMPFPDHRIGIDVVLALVELRLDRPAAALAILADVPVRDPDTVNWLPRLHFVDCCANLALGHQDRAEAAIAALRTLVASSLDEQDRFLLSEAEERLAARR
ncbi:MAG: protein kinase [Planctomycetes bacterium]|nr:protein kinase [Planctomycetota bacterium]